MDYIFCFGITLRSAASSINWERVVSLFSQTLGSILNQTEPDFKVIIACHDIPAIALLQDSRVIIVTMDYAPPTDRAGQMRDKSLKKNCIAAKFREQGGGYLMLVDDDDRVSNRLVEFVQADRSEFGYILNTGYEYDYKMHKLRRCPGFNRICGTCAIFKFSIDDLPKSSMDETSTLFSRVGSHTKWQEVAQSLGRPLKPLSFRGAVYIVNHGDNLSSRSDQISIKRKLWRALFSGSKPTAGQRAEFNIWEPKVD